MADEQEIPTSHGVETQERGLFYFGKKEDNEVMAASFEQNANLQVSEEEKKKPSSISSSSSSSEEEEEVVGEDGEKRKIKKKGLQEKLIEKVGNKVENTSVPEEQPPPALDAYPHVHALPGHGNNKPEEKAAVVTHPPPPSVVEEKEKKGLLEKIKDTIPGFH
ncbi:unnamed protein product [Rhodiola kirilowii]